MLARIMKAMGFGGCRHDWRGFDHANKDFRVCRICSRVEKFEPDCGGWTSGHWDEVK